MIQIDDGIVPLPPQCEVGEINTQMGKRFYSIIMKLCGNTTDCKHDFGSGGPNSKDRSFMNNQDCNETFIKEQLSSCGIKQDIKTLYFQKFLIQRGNAHFLVEKQITSSANTIHEIFDFTSHLIKLPFVLNDRIMIRLIQRTLLSESIIEEYCVCRPFYGEYQLMTHNPSYVFDNDEYLRLKNDVETYGMNGIFCIRVGSKLSFISEKNQQINVIEKINELFHFNTKHYTIDSTHINKEIYELLFGPRKSSEYFLGDKLDPSTAKNGENIRTNHSCKNRFHFCFVRGKQIDIELVHNHENGKFTIQFWSDDNTYSHTISFASQDFTPPSVSDISSYIFENLLKPTSRIGELLSALNKIRKCFVKNTKVAPVVYHNDFFTFILQQVYSLIKNTNPGPLTTQEMITILTSIKTKGDFIRLKDTENLTFVSEGNDAVCLTLDKFLFDLNVSLQKVWMLGDSPGTANFELMVYTRFSPKDIQTVINKYVQFVQESSEITEQIKSNFLPDLDPEKSYGIRATNFFEIKSNISNEIEKNRERTKKSSILGQIRVLTSDENIIQYYINEIEYIDKLIQDNFPEFSSSKRIPNHNFRDVLINDKNQETIIQEIKKIHYNYYVFIIQKFCIEYSDNFNSSTLEQVLDLTKPDPHVISIDDIKVLLDTLKDTLKKISIPPPPLESQTLIFKIFKDVKREINNKSSFFSTATDVLYVKGYIKNYLKYSSIQLPGISKLPDRMEQNGGSPDIQDVNNIEGIVDVFLHIILSVYYYYIDKMEIIDFLDVLCDNIQNCQDASIDHTIKILEKTMNQTIQFQKVGGEQKIIQINQIQGVVIETLRFHMQALPLNTKRINGKINNKKHIFPKYLNKMDIFKNVLEQKLPGSYVTVPHDSITQNQINRIRRKGKKRTKRTKGGNRTKKNRPKKCKNHGTRSKKLSKNKTRKHHSTRSKRKNKIFYNVQNNIKADTKQM